jgi:hypothetical protein
VLLGPRVWAAVSSTKVPEPAPIPTVSTNEPTTPAKGSGLGVTFNAPVNAPMQVGGDHNTQNVTTIHTGPKPRTLAPEQRTHLVTALGPFHGMRINVFRYVGEKEIADLEDEIASALRDAGWVVTEVSGTEMGDKRSHRPVPGILIEVRPQSGAPQQGPAAEALAAGLRSAALKLDGPLQFDAFGRGGLQEQGEEDPHAAIQLTIGKNNP